MASFFLLKMTTHSHEKNCLQIIKEKRDNPSPNYVRQLDSCYSISIASIHSPVEKHYFRIIKTHSIQKSSRVLLVQKFNATQYRIMQVIKCALLLLLLLLLLFFHLVCFIFPNLIEKSSVIEIGESKNLEKEPWKWTGLKRKKKHSHKRYECKRTFLK